MYGPTTQCNSKTYYEIFQLSTTGLNLSQPKSSLISHLINDRLLNAWPIVIQTSPQFINISQKLIDRLVLHCQDSVIYVLKSGMFGSHRLDAIRRPR